MRLLTACWLLKNLLAMNAKTRIGTDHSAESAAIFGPTLFFLNVPDTTSEKRFWNERGFGFRIGQSS